MNPPQKFTHIKHLREFYQPQKQLFIDAQQLPQFFLTNLIDDMRVVKYFHNDPQANITIFYYQYLKLCFEIDNVDYESYIQKIYQLIRTQGFEFYFQPNDPQKEMKNAQYKSLLIDFFEMMNTSSMTIDNVLRQYPILNDVFTNFFRTVVMIASITPSFQAYIDKNELFDFLSSFFSVDISSYDKCLKFVESDIFVYEEDQQNIYMAYIAEEIEGSEDGQHEQGNIKRGSKLLEHEMKTVKEDVQESQVSAGTEQLQIPQIAVRLIQHSATNSTLVPSPDYNINQANAHSLKPRAKTIIKESYIEAQFADYTSFSNNISSFGKNVSAEQQKQVFVEELEPNTTMNETESEGGKRKVFVDGDEDAYELQQKGQKKQQLTRVQSAQHNFLINANRADSLQIEITQPLYNKLQQSHKVQSLTKVNSQPNFLYRQKSLHQLSQSCYQSLDSNIQPQQGQQQVSQKVLRQQFNQQNSNLLQQQQHKSSSKIIISEKNNIPVNEQKMMKKNISSLGLQQQGHMYVSYQQPTKDPGFMEKDLTSRFVQQIGTQQHLQQQQTNRSLYQNLTDYSIYKPSSSIINNNSNIINKNYTTNINSNNNINNNNTATQQSIKLNEPLFYNPTTSTSNLQKQQHQHSSSFPNSRLAQSANSQKQHFYINTNPTSSIKSIGMMNPPIMTQRLKLNVTRQFTNSFVRQSMSEPYKTEVFRTRERAREFRKSIYQQFTSYQMGSSNINNHNFNYQISNNNSNSKVDEYNNYSRPKVDEYNNNTNYSNDYNSYTQHTKKPSSRTSIPSQSSSRKQVTSNRNIQQHQQQKVSPSIKKLQSPQRQQPYHHATSQSSGIYPVSMIKQQNNKVYTYQASLLENSQVNVNNVNNNINNNNNNNVNNNINVNNNNNNNNNINVNNNNNINNNSENISLLSKISQVKQVSQMISSQSRKSITTMKEDRVIQSTSKLSVNSNNKINVQNSHLVYNNNGHLSSSPSQSSFKKLPTYQPVLLTTGGNKLSVGVSNNAQLQYQQQYQQAQKQQKLQYQQHQQQSPQNYTVHTVMPHHYHHSPQKSNYSNFNQQPQQQSNIDSINMKTFPQQQQGLMMSVIPQTHKPLPLYIPFERRK